MHILENYFLKLLDNLEIIFSFTYLLHLPTLFTDTIPFSDSINSLTNLSNAATVMNWSPSLCYTIIAAPMSNIKTFLFGCCSTSASWLGSSAKVDPTRLKTKMMVKWLRFTARFSVLQSRQKRAWCGGERVRKKKGGLEEVEGEKIGD